MARKPPTESKRPIESYEHKGKKRVNNPPVGLVTPDTDPDAGRTRPMPTTRTWTRNCNGRARPSTRFEVPTVSLHVHERIDPRTIIEAVRRRTAQQLPSRCPCSRRRRKIRRCARPSSSTSTPMAGATA